MNTGTYGLGLLIRDALEQGAEKIYIGLGGSGVNDGGLGLLRLGEKYHIPVVCLCGLNESRGDMGFKKIFSIVPRHATYQESIASPEESLRRLILEEVRQWVSR